MNRHDVYSIIEGILLYELPIKDRYILSELNEAKTVQIRTTNWNTHNKITSALDDPKYGDRLNNTIREGWCEGLNRRKGSEGEEFVQSGLDHGDIQVIEVRFRKAV